MPIVTTPEFNNEKLDQAVSARGIQWKDLSGITEIPANTISNYRKGRVRPSPDQLDKIAEALDFPVEFFLKGEMPGARLVGPRLFRAKSSLTKRASLQAEARLQWVSKALVFAERHLVTPKASFIDQVGFEGDPLVLDEVQIESIAQRTRESLGFGDGPISNLVRTLERSGVPVLRYECLSKPEIDGLSQHNELGRPLCAIFANPESCLPREYFTLCHELGHIVLHSKINPTRFDGLADEKRIEDQANRFASAFLLPSMVFRNDVGFPSLKQFIFLKRKWKASIACMIFRCRDLGIIDNLKYKSLFVQLSQKRWRKREPLDDHCEVEQPVLLKKIFETLADRDGLSGSRIATMLDFNPSDLSSISGLPYGFFDGVPEIDNTLAFPSR